MPAFYYSSVAGVYTLTGGITASTTAIVLNSVAGLPASTPYKVVLNPGESGEEIVKVTAVAGMTLTVVRGWDGTVATSHAAGATVRHMVTAEDLTLSRTHEDATAAHGATGAVVGTTSSQSLSNKNLTSGTNTFPSSLASLTGTQAFTNKDLTSGTNTFPTSLATLTDTQTLTNKNLTAATNTFPTTLARTAGQAFTGNVTAPNLPAASSLKAGKRIHYWSDTGTTNASGLVTITHNAGFTPTFITGHAVASDETGRFLHVFSYGATTATLRITKSDYTAYANAFIAVALFIGE